LKQLEYLTTQKSQNDFSRSVLFEWREEELWKVSDVCVWDGHAIEARKFRSF
jgi:hypothetical protein